MNEDRKAIDRLLEEIDLMIKEVDTETGKTKANAYGVRIQDYYAIELRDEFNKLDGQYNALIQVKNKILEIIDEGVSMK